MDFGKYADYMALGYAAMALILGGMILWMYLRYRALLRQEDQIAQLEAELKAERAAAAPAASRVNGKGTPQEAAVLPGTRAPENG